MRRCIPLWALAALAFAMLAGAALSAASPSADGDQIFFSKSFPGSKPGYFEVTVDATGNATYREDPEEEHPVEFQLSSDETSKVFELAETIDRFRGEFQSDRKVAFTGEKVLRYSSAAGDSTETKFNFTTDKDAQAIVAWFERAGETERHRIELERVVQFDRLGVNKALLLFQVSFDDGRIVGASQFLPVLKTIVEDSKVIHMARSRAASLIERINSGDR